MSLPLTKATYQARAIGCGFGTAQSGNHQIAVQLEIIEDSAELANNGERIAWLGHFTDKTTDRTVESLQHLGWKGDDLGELEELDAEACARLLPDVVEIVCEPEEYEGTWRLRVKWINKVGGGRFAFKEPLTGSALKAFAAQMRGTIRNAQQGGGAPRKTTAPAAAPARNGGGSGYRSTAPHPNAPGNDDDIPF